MLKCSYCGIKEENKTPLCQSCGALRFPIESNPPTYNISRQQKLKLSASLAVAIFTPGSFIILALMGANRINAKIKNRNMEK